MGVQLCYGNGRTTLFDLQEPPGWHHMPVEAVGLPAFTHDMCQPGSASLGVLAG